MDVLNNNPLLSAATRPGERIHLRSETLCQAGNGKGNLSPADAQKPMRHHAP
jgi:hypothetical protein